MLLKLLFVAALAASTKADLTEEELALFEKYGDLFKEHQDQLNDRSRRQIIGPVVQTKDGNIVIQVESDKQMILKIGNDKPVDIAGIPDEVRGYSDDTLKSFATGFQTARVNDNTDALLTYFNKTFLDNEREAKESIGQVADDLQEANDEMKQDVADSLTATTTKLNAELAQTAKLLTDQMASLVAKNDALKKEISGSVTDKLKALEDKLDAVGSNSDGKTEGNAGATCKAIKAQYKDSKDGVYYLKNSVPLAGSTGRYVHGVLKVYCSFSDNWTYNNTKGGLFYMTYEDGQSEPYTLITQKAQYEFSCYGAAGGRGYHENRQHGGWGGMAKGLKSFAAGITLFMYPGGRGAKGWKADNGANDEYFDQRYHFGGWNGGGIGTQGGSGGGGSTDIRTMRADPRSIKGNTLSLNSRMLVGGGGGGCGHNDCDHRGGHGGDATGETQRGMYGGSQSAGGRNYCNHNFPFGEFGHGGNVQLDHTRNDGGGGGGGWYGGSGACSSNRPGAGGSSYYSKMEGNGRGFRRGINHGNGYVTYRWRDL